jgi:tetraacyldisaccharide 4'-kinase
LYFFLKERGWTPGIVSRGYKGQYAGIAWVAADSDPVQVGDEAVLLAARTGAAVVVARQRSSAIKTLLQQTACDIILSDDGLQHYAMQRDLEIVVIDATKKLGNQWCLPAGPLREPISRLKKVDLVVFNRGEASQCAFSLTAMSLINVSRPTITLSVQTLQGKKVHALAGIASPQRFFNYLISLGAEVIAHPYPDHYQFKSRDLQGFSVEDQIIMTEKDAVKCRAFATKNSWFLPIEAQLNLTLVTALEDCLQHLPRM